MEVRAAVANSPTGQFTIETLNLRDPLDDEVLVKITCSGVCNSDINFLRTEGQEFPIVMGHEGAGIIEKLGKSVSNFKVGDHVIIATNNCGKCPSCQKGKIWQCDHSFDYWLGIQFDRTSPLTTKEGKPVKLFSCHGTFADHVVVRSNSLVYVDPCIDLRHVCFLGCCPITGAGGVLNYFQAKEGQSILIIGMGTVGLTAVMASKIANLKSIIVIDRHPEKLELAKEFGATVLINPNVDKKLTSLGDFIQKEGQIDFCEDTAGNKNFFDTAYSYLSDKTKVYDVTGNLGNDNWPFVCGGASNKNLFIPQMIKYYQEGKFPVDKLVSYYKFEDINKACSDIAEKKVIRPVITFD